MWQIFGRSTAFYTYISGFNVPVEVFQLQTLLLRGRQLIRKKRKPWTDTVTTPQSSSAENSSRNNASRDYALQRRGTVPQGRVAAAA